MAMKYDFIGIDNSQLSIGNICSKITTNNGELRNLESNLKNCFTSEGSDDSAATAWHTQIDLLMAKIDDYQVKLGKLQQAIMEAGASMQTTDKNQGFKFLGVKV